MCLFKFSFYNISDTIGTLLWRHYEPVLEITVSYWALFDQIFNGSGQFHIMNGHEVKTFNGNILTFFSWSYCSSIKDCLIRARNCDGYGRQCDLHFIFGDQHTGLATMIVTSFLLISSFCCAWCILEGLVLARRYKLRWNLIGNKLISVFSGQKSYNRIMFSIFKSLLHFLKSRVTINNCLK